ncbi:hypothetical protein ACFSWE_00020 [Leucobacter albus]|uniref:Uncharacterized protein n=1 Tax=Leucobacter albus TaxID=272210 RepID=A0ABW3TSK9_9MICO
MKLDGVLEKHPVDRATVETAKVGTNRRYLEAVGGDLSIEFVVGASRVQVA